MTSKTPGPDLIAQRQKVAGRSEKSMNFGPGGSKSNISSIVHMEEVSAGRNSIDRQEYRIQQRKNTGVINIHPKMQTSRSSKVLKDEPMSSKVNLNQASGKDLQNLQQ